MSGHDNLARWHAYFTSGDRAQLAELLAEDAVFHSPVVHTPQAGKAKVMAYLGAAGSVFGKGSFRYVREIVDGDNVMLEFEAEMDGIHVNGIDLIRFNAQGQIEDFKVMVRPLKAINKVWEMMAAQLQAAQG
jgi:predicted SnoaL-like aldol condensation-catalyzing enzyme